MRLTSGLLTNTYRTNKRFGWLVPLLACAKEQGASISSAKAFYEHCDQMISPHADVCLNAHGLPTIEGPWSSSSAQPLFQWAKGLGLVETDGWNITDLGAVWLEAWGGVTEIWKVNPLLTTDIRRKWVAWSTLLAADGLLLLSCWSSMTAQAMSMEAIGKRIITKLGDITLPAHLRKTAAWIRKRLSDATKSTQYRDLLSCRIVPLVDLGIAVAGKNGSYGLSTLGTDLQPEIAQWLDDSELMSTIHLHKAWYIASRADTANENDLLKTLPRFLRQAGATLWPYKRQWPLQEALLFAECLSIQESAGGFELAQGISVLERLRELRPGTVEWVPGRQKDERYFRLVDVPDVPALFAGQQLHVPDIAPDSSNTASMLPSESPGPEVIVAMTLPATAGNGDVEEPAPHQNARIANDHASAGTKASQELPVWFRDLIENQLLFEEDRPAGLPLLGATSALQQLLQRTEGLVQSTSRKQDGRFWLRLTRGNALGEASKKRIAGKDVKLAGLYGLVLNSLETTFYNDVPTISKLPERLLRHREDRQDMAHRMWCAHGRIIETRNHAILHQRVLCEWLKNAIDEKQKLEAEREKNRIEEERIKTEKQKSKTEDKNTKEATDKRIKEDEDKLKVSVKKFNENEDKFKKRIDQTKLFLRDALVEGRLHSIDLAPVFDRSTGIAALGRVFEKLFPVSQSTLPCFDVTLTAGLPVLLVPALAQAYPGGRLGLVRKYGFVEETLELAIPTTDSLDGNDSGELTATAAVYGSDERDARARAKAWLYEHLEPYSLAWVFDSLDQQPIWVEAKAASIAIAPIVDDDAPNVARNGIDPTRLHAWRPPVDSAILMIARLHSAGPELNRTIAWWHRAQVAPDALTRFNCLWSGIEHLVGPTQGLAFTARLARTIVFPALRRRVEALAHETVQRLLRAIADVENADEAKELYDLMCMFCMNAKQTEKFCEDFPIESLRGSSLLPSRHPKLQTASIGEILRLLDGNKAQMKRFLEQTNVYAPSLSPIWEKWDNARNKRQRLLALVVEEHDHIVVQFGICYDMRNRIQHEGDHFPGDGSSLLNEAAHYLRGWLRLLMESLLQSHAHLDESIERRIKHLQLSFEDLMASFGEGKLDGAPTEEELALLVGPAGIMR